MLELGVDAVRTGGEWQGTAASGGVPAVSPPELGAPIALFRTDDPTAGGPVCAVCADPAHCGDAPPAKALAWHPRRLIAAVSAGRAAVSGAAPLWLLAEPGAPRTAARFGPDAARLAATLLLTLPGVSVVAGGDEIGVVDGPPRPEVGRRPGSAERMSERAPMPWDERPDGGFAPAPWRPLVESGAVPVSRQRRDPDSLLAFHRRLIALRRNEPTLVHGTASLVLADGGMLTYLLDGAGSRFLVALNGGPDPATVPFLRGPLSGHVALATDRGREGTRVTSPIALGPNEAVVVRLSG
jgi:alpha-glucosidase